MTSNNNNARTATPSASQLLSSTYRSLGSPPVVGRRFLKFLLDNQRTLTALSRTIMIENSSQTTQQQNRRMPSSSSSSNNNSNNVTANSSSVSVKIPTDNWTRDITLQIDAFDLILYDPELGHMLLRYPSTLLPLLEEAAVEAQREVLRSTISLFEQKIAKMKGTNPNHHQRSPQPQSRPSPLPPPPTIKTTSRQLSQLRQLLLNNPRRIHARILHLPPNSSCCKPSLSTIRADDVGKIVQISGTVVRATPVRMVEFSRAYRCRKKTCGYVFSMYCDFEQYHNAQPTPTTCPRRRRRRRNGGGGGGGRRNDNGGGGDDDDDDGGDDDCDGTEFDILEDGGHRGDYQEIKILESIGMLKVGSIPRSMLIKLEHDLVDSCHPGDEVLVVGTLISQWRPVLPNVDCDISMALRAHSIKVVNTEDHSIWNGEDGMNDNKFRREFDRFWNLPQNKEKPIAARDFICRAVCPKLYGMSVVKLGLLLTIIGGSSSVAANNVDYLSQNSQNQVEINEDSSEEDEPEQFEVTYLDNSRKLDRSYGYQGHNRRAENSDRRAKRRSRMNQSIKTKRRAQSHILLVGDPGTGKSQFLRFAAALSPRSVLTTGVGTSSAGLTCAAIRDEGSNNREFALEAGALVLADRGVCCIDEFGCIRKEDLTTIHEAMEQQTISVAKGGIVCKLNSRATVVAVMNPRGGLYDVDQSLRENTGIATPLLSRFDLIFEMLDQSHNDFRDSRVAEHLLNQVTHHGYDYEIIAAHAAGADATTTDATTGNNDDDAAGVWNMDKLRGYIATVKERFQPQMTTAAALLLQKHYSYCRERQNDVLSLPVTVRYLESLIRLSQAHARLMYRDTVTRQDAMAVIFVMECSAASTSQDFRNPEDMMYTSPVETFFDSDADGQFKNKERIVLRRFHMEGGYDDDNDDNPDERVMDEQQQQRSNTREWEKVEHLRDAVHRPPSSYQFRRSMGGSQNSSSGTDQYGRSLHRSPGKKKIQQSIPEGFEESLPPPPPLSDVMFSSKFQEGYDQGNNTTRTAETCYGSSQNSFDTDQYGRPLQSTSPMAKSRISQDGSRSILSGSDSVVVSGFQNDITMGGGGVTFDSRDVVNTHSTRPLKNGEEHQHEKRRSKVKRKRRHIDAD